MTTPVNQYHAQAAFGYMRTRGVKLTPNEWNPHEARSAFVDEKDVALKLKAAEKETASFAKFATIVAGSHSAADADAAMTAYAKDHEANAAIKFPLTEDECAALARVQFEDRDIAVAALLAEARDALVSRQTWKRMLNAKAWTVPAVEADADPLVKALTALIEEVEHPQHVYVVNATEARKLRAGGEAVDVHGDDVPRGAQYRVTHGVPMSREAAGIVG